MTQLDYHGISPSSKRKTFELYSWENFDNDLRQIKVFLEGRGRTYTGIYAVPRGGLVLGVKLSHMLDLPLIFGGVTKDTLVVDEIADTGDALHPYLKKCDTVVLHRNIHCPIKPTFWAQDSEGYVIYPWEDAEKEMQRCYGEV